jgi:hypothetical protein
MHSDGTLEENKAKGKDTRWFVPWANAQPHVLHLLLGSILDMLK